MKKAANTREPLKCKWCGKEFVPTSYRNVFCCRTCMTEHNIEEKKSKRHTKQTNAERIRDIAQEAKAHGMSYGKYVAYLEMQKNRGGEHE